MLNQLIATRVAEALAAAAVTPAASTQEEKLVVPTLQELGMQYKDSISNVAEGDRVKFAFYTLLDGALTCGITALGMNKAIGKCVVVLKSEGYKLTAYNQPVSRTHPFLPCDVPSRPDGLLERYIVVYLWSIVTSLQKCGTTTQLCRMPSCFYNYEKEDIMAKIGALHLVPQTKEDQEAKEDKEVMSLVLDVVRKDTT
ncbi:hypothetical protein Tco_0093205 [Tanacetum coccineum]